MHIHVLIIWICKMQLNEKEKKFYKVTYQKHLFIIIKYFFINFTKLKYKHWILDKQRYMSIFTKFGMIVHMLKTDKMPFHIKPCAYLRICLNN